MPPVKRKKSYYVQYNKKPKANRLAVGMRGFIISCNGQEKQCIKESYNILNEYADNIYGMVQPETEKAVEVEESLEHELQALQAEGKQPHRFQQVFTGTQNCLFVQTQLEEPCKLVLAILQDLKETQMQKTKYLLRMTPVHVTCKPYEEKIQAGIIEAIELFLNHSPEFRAKEKVLYMILFKARKSKLTKTPLVTCIIAAIENKGISWEPELNNPDVVLTVDVICNMCCLGVLPGYLEYKKYNLVEIVKSGDAEPDDGDCKTKCEEQSDPESKDDSKIGESDREIKSEERSDPESKDDSKNGNGDDKTKVSEGSIQESIDSTPSGDDVATLESEPELKVEALNLAEAKD